MKRILLLAAVYIAVLCQSVAMDLELTDGRVLKDVRVLSSDPIDLMVMHADGVENVPLEICPKEVKEEFGYDPAQAAATFNKREQERDRKELQIWQDKLVEYHAQLELEESERKHAALKLIKPGGRVSGIEVERDLTLSVSGYDYFATISFDGEEWLLSAYYKPAFEEDENPFDHESESGKWSKWIRQEVERGLIHHRRWYGITSTVESVDAANLEAFVVLLESFLSWANKVQSDKPPAFRLEVAGIDQFNLDDPSYIWDGDKATLSLLSFIDSVEARLWLDLIAKHEELESELVAAHERVQVITQ